MAALFVCTEQTLIDILLAFTDRNDMIKKNGIASFGIITVGCNPVFLPVCKQHRNCCSDKNKEIGNIKYNS